MSSTNCAGCEQPCRARRLAGAGRADAGERRRRREARGRAGRATQHGQREGGELLGSAKAAASKKEPDALATRVLSRGEALAAPHGRADDFSWPRADISSEPAPDTPPPPAASPSKGGTNKSESKNEKNKSETNTSRKGQSKKTEPKKPAPDGASNAAPNGLTTGAPNATPNAAPLGHGKRSTAARCRGHLCRLAQPRRVRAGLFSKLNPAPFDESEGGLGQDDALA